MLGRNIEHGTSYVTQAMRTDGEVNERVDSGVGV